MDAGMWLVDGITTSMNNLEGKFSAICNYFPTFRSFFMCFSANFFFFILAN